MTTTVFFASKSLGALTDSQLQRMLDRFGLGRLLHSAPTEHGVMKQTLFVTSTAGQSALSRTVEGRSVFYSPFAREDRSQGPLSLSD
ncbi:hypothetical protein WJ0W_001981 [Paenibacillus melissococcoides]|uniref:Uncharacterized protein n=1 Tax=Paenibacillus melissococcoides TaxID=2912268 RepID=A0ABN8U108_9BACL|nr:MULTISPECIES: hypothetical protein [Paenibacillus]MEB9892852.1 hypothetical protein [Bacillus cereus]CAH8244751.1 hypothetical protein WJ0W_001981 [Paenibacillus melissococcoides]CAH8708865.1 hypothetical protein WDD9_002063 [Paenibacillus melissococcoides]CAH8709618.1 hypothetical protein HTL2_002351 [Paenibacillus melissococcoides]